MQEENHEQETPAGVLTIAGSDSGGAAGLQADLKTFTAIGVYGMSVVTAVTAQNSVQVMGVQALPAEFVGQQIDAVLDDYPVAAVKTGFTGRVEIITTIAERLRRHGVTNLIVDPVLVNHRGEAMFPQEIASAYQETLFPLARLITPNYKEAGLLAGRVIDRVDDLVPVASAIWQRGPQAILITGFLDGDDVVDLFYTGRETQFFRHSRVITANLHGSGDTLSAAIAAYLAQGHGLHSAIALARTFTRTAILQATHWQLGAGHGPLNHLFHGK